ncbi:Putative monooxygenase YcnE [Saezia sanguinis]|uniref:Monooxygenase YcnE n=1 Tax=Saezia sanguinis TaxID=1965230 RepID=A0A433SFN6_9BURK|nr:putative quinol monooxygenase [Saezia sanguinis]RUS67579.1 Putative monooxygenase YcnE [Saezia sanguinis]
MTNQIIIVAALSVKPECKQEVLQFLKGLIEKSREETGNIQYNLHQSTTDANKLTFIEIWESQKAVDTHGQTPHFKAFEAFIKDKVDALSIELMQKII